MINNIDNKYYIINIDYKLKDNFAFIYLFLNIFNYYLLTIVPLS